MHRAEKRCENPNNAEAREDKRQQKAGRGGERDPKSRKRHRPHHAHDPDQQEIGLDQPGEQPAHFGPGIERSDRKIGKGKCGHGTEQEQAAGGEVT